MFAEKIAITVTSNGKTYRKVKTIFSDGAYQNVDAAVKNSVAVEWALIGIEVDSISWSYTN